ncbi:MAG: S8 family serine peptidase, partial [Acidimicrobiia bacterium]
PVAVVVASFLGTALIPASGVAAGPASNDPELGRQWGLEQIGAPAAWARSTGAGIRIGIVDTGIDLAHEDLVGQVAAHTSCIGAQGDPDKCTGSAQDEQGHGTHVAGIAAAVRGNARGVSGVAPNAELVVVKAIDSTGTGNTTDIVAGIKWVVDRGAKVVNLSLGDPNFVFTGLTGTPLQEGLDYAWEHGAVPVLASGNTSLLGLGSSNYGDLDAMVVGATDPEDRVASYSSPLGNAKWGILAPGGAGAGAPDDDIYSTFWKDGASNQYQALAGTSMATPHVAAAVALLLAKGHTRDSAVARLLETAHQQASCESESCPGRLDVARALAGA